MTGSRELNQKTKERGRGQDREIGECFLYQISIIVHIYNYFSNVKGNNPTSNEHVIIDDSRQGNIFNMLSAMKNQLPYERFINSKSYDNGFDIQIASIYGELSNGLKKYYNKLNATDFDGYSIDSMHTYIAEPLLSSELESREIYDLIKNKNGNFLAIFVKELS